MTITCEQLFYGRGERGYAILGASPGAGSFAARIVALCGSVGTPGGNYGGEPFLLSVPEGDRVLMVCGRRGAPDSMGRETLFFHALVAAKTDLVAAKADAFSLFAQGAFAAKMPGGAIGDIRIDFKPGRDSSTSRPPDGRAVGASLPCFIRVPSPAPDIVRLFVGRRANDLAWATFAFQPLDGFDVQVLPPRTAAPHSVNECGANGNLVRAAEMSGGRTAPAHSASAPYHNGTPKQPPSSSKPSTMLKISLFANLALLALCTALLASRKSVPAPVSKPEPTIVTNTVTITNVQTRVIENPVFGSNGEKQPVQEESKKEFLSKLEIPELVTTEDLDGIRSFNSEKFSEIKGQLSAIIDFIKKLKQQKEQQ